MKLTTFCGQLLNRYKRDQLFELIFNHSSQINTKLKEENAKLKEELAEAKAIAEREISLRDGKYLKSLYVNSY